LSDAREVPGSDEPPATRIWKNRWFADFAHSNAISDAQLCEAIERAERGLIDADLGGGVIKQRIARPGQGRSGGFRTVVFFKAARRAFFVFGFAKSRRENLAPTELRFYKSVAPDALQQDESALEAQMKTGELIEVFCNEKDL